MVETIDSYAVDLDVGRQPSKLLASLEYCHIVPIASKEVRRAETEKTTSDDDGTH
jgi:hypothetical protein